MVFLKELLYLEYCSSDCWWTVHSFLFDDQLWSAPIGDNSWINAVTCHMWSLSGDCACAGGGHLEATDAH